MPSSSYTPASGGGPVSPYLDTIPSGPVTRGSTLYRGLGEWTALGIGTEDQVLAVNSSGEPEWVMPSGGSGGSNLLAETQAYMALRVAASDPVDAYAASRIDHFIFRGQNTGWWTKCKEIGLLMGETLAGALVKLKSGTGAPTSMVAHGAISYDPVLGVYPTSASVANYLDMEYVPSADGISGADVMLAGGYSSIDLNYYNVGLATMLDSSENSQLALNTNGHIGNFVQPTAFINGLRELGLALMRGDATDARRYVGGVKTQSSTALDSSTTITRSLNMFRWCNSGTIYGAGPSVKMNFYAIGTALSEVQTADFHDAVMELYSALGRDFYPRPLFVGVGDSTGISNDIFQLAAQKLGTKGYLNTSVGGTTYTALGHAQFDRVLALKPEFVHINKFTNDLAGGDGATPSGYQSLLTTDATIYRQAGARVLIGSLVRWSVIPDADVDTLNLAASNAARAAGVVYVDLVWALRDEAARMVFTAEAADLATAQTALVYDGVHPSTLGFNAMRPHISAAWNGDHYRKPILNLASVSAGGHVDEVLAFVGASVGDAFDVTPPSGFADGLTARAFCAAVDTVTLRVANATAGSIDPAEGQYVIHQRR